MTARPSSASPGDQMVDLGNGADVHAARGLIEYDELRFLDQSLGDDHFLLIAARKLYDPGIVVQRLEFESFRPSGGGARASRSY